MEEKIKKYKTDNQKLLMDYFKKVVGTPMEMPYFEYALYTYTDEELILERYDEGGTSEEVCRQILVPFDVYKEALKIINKYKLKKYIDHHGLMMVGISKVIKFRENTQDNEMYRFTINNSPNEKTLKVFDELKSLFDSTRNTNV